MQSQTLWEKELDSMKTLLQSTKQDSIKVELLLNIGSHYEYNNPKIANKYHLESYELAKKIKNDYWQMRGLACLMVSTKTSAEANYYGTIGIGIAKKTKNKHAEAAFYNNLASTFDNLDNMKQCLNYYQRSRSIYEKLANRKDTLNLLVVYGNILGVYAKYEQPQKAYELAKKILAIAKKANDDDALLNIYPNYATILIQLKKYPQALKIINDEYQIARKSNNKNKMADALGLKIKCCQESDVQCNYLETALQMKKLSEESDYGQGLANSYYYLAMHYLKKKENSNARKNGLLALHIISKYELKKTFEEVNELLSHIELASGNIKGYQYYLKELKKIQSKNNLNKILHYSQELEAKYALNKKQEKINELNIEKKFQNRITSLLLIAIITSLLFGFFFFNYLKDKNKLLIVKEQLQTQKISELEQQQQLVVADILIKGQEAERERVARDLHDGLGGILSGVKFSLQNMDTHYFTNEENSVLFTKALQQLDSGISEMRRVAHNMMPESLIKFGLKSAIEDFCEGIFHTQQLVIQFDCFGFEERIEQSTEVIIYRIIQELITNVLKHSQAKQVIVQLIKNENMVLITVEDNGKGFDINQLQHNKNFGIANVQSRVNYLNGTFQIKSEKEKGTNITIEFTL